MRSLLAWPVMAPPHSLKPNHSEAKGSGTALELLKGGSVSPEHAFRLNLLPDSSETPVEKE